MTVVLMLPAVAVSAVLRWSSGSASPRPRPSATGRLDLRGFGLVTLAIALVMAGLILVRLQGPGSLAAVGCSWLLGLLALRGRSRGSSWRRAEPLIDVRLLATPAQWPVQLTAFLFGMSVLGAQIPLSTFARTDPDEAGYGLGASARASSPR